MNNIFEEIYNNFGYDALYSTRLRKLCYYFYCNIFSVYIVIVQISSPDKNDDNDISPEQVPDENRHVIKWRMLLFSEH